MHEIRILHTDCGFLSKSAKQVREKTGLTCVKYFVLKHFYCTDISELIATRNKCQREEGNH